MSAPTDILIQGIPFQTYHRALIPTVSPDRNFSVSRAAALAAMRQTRCIMLRYTNEFDSPAPSNFWHVINDRFVPVSARKGNRRRTIQRGLDRFEFKRVHLDVVLAEGYPVHVAALARYGVAPPFREQWVAGLRSNSRNKEYWLACDRATGTPVAYGITLPWENSCLYSTLKFDPAGFPDGLSNAMIYALDKHYLADRGFRFVTDGERTLAHSSGIQDYLIHQLGYRRAYCQVHVEFPAAVAWLARLGAFAIQRGWRMPSPLALLGRHHLLAIGADLDDAQTASPTAT